MVTRKPHSRKRRGVVLIVSMMFLLVFSSLAISMAAMSGTNLQIADNHHKANAAFSAAESGLEIFRYWLSDLSVPLSVSADERLASIANDLQSKLDNAGVSNISPTYNNSEITISTVNLDSQASQSFTIVMQQIHDDTLQLNVTGRSGQVTRTLSTHFNFVTRADPVFDYGVATRGPLRMSGNVELEIAAGSNVYIDSEGADYALMMQGNSEISSNVNISAPYPVISVSNNCVIGGESGTEAVENHVFVDVNAIELPVPEVSSFTQYIQNVINADSDTSGNLTLDNISIIADTNPNFTGNVNLRGIVFIEQPNIVRFGGNVIITGIIIGNGDIQSPSDLNRIVFSGNVDTYGVSELPNEDQFVGLRGKTGSFLLAPGFSVSFNGSTSISNGVIAASGITFSGNAGGDITGTIMNYSLDPLSMSGNSDLNLTPSGTNVNPSGFAPIKVLEFVPSSYSEVH